MKTQRITHGSILMRIAAYMTMSFVTMTFLSSCTYIPTPEEARTAGYTYEDLVKVRSVAVRKYSRLDSESDALKRLELRTVITALSKRIAKFEKTPQIVQIKPSLTSPIVKPRAIRDPDLVKRTEDFLRLGNSVGGPTDDDLARLKEDNKATEAALQRHKEYYQQRTGQP